MLVSKVMKPEDSNQCCQLYRRADHMASLTDLSSRGARQLIQRLLDGIHAALQHSALNTRRTDIYTIVFKFTLQYAERAINNITYR